MSDLEKIASTLLFDNSWWHIEINVFILALVCLIKRNLPASKLFFLYLENCVDCEGVAFRSKEANGTNDGKSEKVFRSNAESSQG